MKYEMYICTKCGYIGHPKTEARGTFIMELLLWVGGLFILFFSWPIIFIPIAYSIIPIAYSIYRLTERYRICPRCHSKDSMIPLETAGGRKAYKEFSAANREELPREKE